MSNYDDSHDAQKPAAPTERTVHRSEKTTIQLCLMVAFAFLAVIYAVLTREPLPFLPA